MPSLRMRAIEADKIRTISRGLVDELQNLIKCPREYFSLEAVHSTYIKDDELVAGSPMVEVFWFDRGQKIQDEAAEIITKYVNLMGYKDVDVVFTVLEESRYYENGKHF